MQLAVDLSARPLITSEPIFVELLGLVCGFGPEVRRSAAQLIRQLQSHPLTKVVHQTRDLFGDGLALFEDRDDKGYSLTDCMSMVVCRAHDVSDVLTADRHFEQEGFTALLRGG
jgi:predicted nucleic acid-binding protein